MVKAISITSFCILATLFSYGQQSEPSLLLARKENILRHSKSSQLAKLITGKAYNIRGEINAVSSPLFMTDDLYVGSIVYDGARYESVDIQYDLYLDKVIVLIDSDNTFPVELDADKVTSFNLEKYHFVFVSGDNVLQEGMYQLAFSGSETDLLIRRTKNRRESIKNSKIQVSYDQKNPISSEISLAVSEFGRESHSWHLNLIRIRF